MSKLPDARNQICAQETDQLKTEYAALSSFFNRVVTFRFTTLGFFLATVGLIIGRGTTSPANSILLCCISIALWLIELRNRSLLNNISRRGMDIERRYWHYKGPGRAYQPFYSHMMKESPPAETDPNPGPKPPPDYTHVFWGLKIKREISHTLGIDLLYLFVFLYAIGQLVFLFCAKEITCVDLI